MRTLPILPCQCNSMYPSRVTRHCSTKFTDVLNMCTNFMYKWDNLKVHDLCISSLLLLPPFSTYSKINSLLTFKTSSKPSQSETRRAAGSPRKCGRTECRSSIDDPVLYTNYLVCHTWSDFWEQSNRVFGRTLTNPVTVVTETTIFTPPSWTLELSRTIIYI